MCIVPKLLTGSIPRRLSSTRERRMNENQTGCRPGRVCMARISTLANLKTAILQKFLIYVPHNLKSAFNSIDRAVSCSRFSL